MMSHQFVNLFPQGGVDAHDVGRGKLNVVQQHLWDYRHQGVTCKREKEDGKKSRVIISVVKLQSCHPNFCNTHDGGIPIPFTTQDATEKMMGPCKLGFGVEAS